MICDSESIAKARNQLEELPIDDTVRCVVCPRALPASWPAKLEDWLTPRELEELSSFRHPSRRDNWIGGRWCAKRLLSSHYGDRTTSLHQWQILSRGSNHRGVYPVVFRDGMVQQLHLSISHSDRVTAAAVSGNDEGKVGLDVVDKGELPESFAASWFSKGERNVLLASGWSYAAGWAAKEAVYKACNEGESFQPRGVQLTHADDHGCSVRYQSTQVADVHLTCFDKAVIAIARRIEWESRSLSQANREEERMQHD
ncbi:MAG: 4'-phosphopantetheinyl transferase superfamily protein [Planctomycetota bacterium]